MRYGRNESIEIEWVDQTTELTLPYLPENVGLTRTGRERLGFLFRRLRVLKGKRLAKFVARGAEGDVMSSWSPRLEVAE